MRFIENKDDMDKTEKEGYSTIKFKEGEIIFKEYPRYYSMTLQSQKILNFIDDGFDCLCESHKGWLIAKNDITIISRFLREVINKGIIKKGDKIKITIEKLD